MAADTRRSSAPYSLGQLRRDLHEDITTYLRFSGEYHRTSFGIFTRISALVTPSVFTCVLYRISHWLHQKNWSRLSLLPALINQHLNKTVITPSSQIGPGLYIPHPATAVVFIGTAGKNLRLFAGSAVGGMGYTPLHRFPNTGCPTLGDNVSLGSKAFVCGEVVIGDQVRVGFNCYIDRDIPANTTVTGDHVRNSIQPQPSRANS